MFHFRLQRVLELREHREQAEAAALAKAEQVAAEARAERDQLQALQSGARVKLSAAQRSDPTVGHLHHLGFVLNALDERIGKASVDVQNTEHLVEAARHTLELAARDRRVMDRLKDRQQEEHHVVETHRDRVQMDEIALGRFTRRRIDHSRADTTRTDSNRGGASGAEHSIDGDKEG